MPKRKTEPNIPQDQAAIEAAKAYSAQQSQLRSMGPIVPPLLVTIDQLRVEVQKIRGDNAMTAGVSLDIAHSQLIAALSKMSILPQ
jgi:hypothetical protein